MYVAKNKIAPLGLTDSEVLWDKVSMKRMRQIIRNSKHKVLGCNRDTNSYGEFLFITVADENKCVTFYGLGRDWNRDRYIIDEWLVGSDDQVSSWKKRMNVSRALNKERVLKTILADATTCRKRAKGQRQSASGQRFEMFADLSDDDFAYSNRGLF